MDFQDKTLTCSDCGKDFTFTVDEQKFYEEKGFENEPKRCPDCRKAKKAQFRGERKMYDVTCADCGKETQVPFQPRGDRPVYCRDCFEKHKND